MPFIWGGDAGKIFAQRSKHGTKTVGASTVVVNEYTALTADASAGATTITVALSSLNATSRFPLPLLPGDLIMIIQMQGATTNGVLAGGLGTPPDSSWGRIDFYNNCGNWEFAEVFSVPTITSITLSCPLKNNYTATGRAQVVRVPRYSSLIINAGGIITCDTWNITPGVGGVCAIEVEINTTINTGGSIDATGKGFRGAALVENLATQGVPWIPASTFPVDGAEKGEGIAGYQADYDLIGGRYCKASPANGGGGGNAHNGGGGGGANGGDILTWNGHGMPDNSVAGYTAAWELEYVGLSTQTSSGGGKGGYTWSAVGSNNPTVSPNGPNDLTAGAAIWGGDRRYSAGGFGGRPLDYSTGRLFLGGGGGSGDQNENSGGAGANGGGIIYLMNYGILSSPGTGQIISNGNIGSNTKNTDNDGAGGGGAGGTIVVNSVGAISGVTMTANGGKGGDQSFSSPFIDQAEGPGGGGSGGYIAISNGAPVRTTNGGTNGTSNSRGVTPEFPPNGATAGGVGTNNATITNFAINAANTTICTGQAATLTGTLSGNPPGGTTIIWYDAHVGGNVLPSTGGTLTTSVIATAGTYTYYVAASCPSTYHQPVLVTVTSSPVISVSPNSTICSGGNTTLNASGASTYTWSPTTGLSNPNISNPIANPVSTTTYVVSATTPCGTGTATVVVDVASSFAPSISGNTTICTGGNTSLTASGGTTYSWSTGSSNTTITVSPTATATYTLDATSGSCTGTVSVTVTVSNGINASISPGNSTLCPGSPTTLSASGGNTYSWSTTETTAAINVAPTSTNTYSVTVISGSCSSTASVTLTISNNLVATINGPTNICTGTSATLTASGGSTYSWSTTETTSSITVTPAGSTTYSVLVSAGTCTNTASFTVNTGPNLSVNISGNTSVCSGSNTTLTATGGSTYSWSNGATDAAIIVSPGINLTYTVIGGSGGCSDTDSVSVTVMTTPTVAVTANTTVCGGDNVTLNASGGTGYAWSNSATSSSTIVNPTGTTTYTVVTTSGNCSDTGTVTVTIASSPIAGITGNNNICQGLMATLNASPSGATYVWSSGETTQSINPATAGTYSVIVSIGSCKDTAVVTTTIAPNPSAVAFSNVTIAQGQSANLSATGGTTYLWDNSMTGANITVSPLATTIYCVTVYDANNCFDSACVTVRLDICPTILYLPNAFSPNGDTENDELKIYYDIPTCIEKFHLVLYNRWGEMVYETSDKAFKWDGSYKGWFFGEQTGGTEVYMYYMDAEITGGTKISRRGNISLVR
jgi:gliding motility-associated-like protein